jgi:hypothetical protein
MTIKECIVQLLEMGKEINLIKITNTFNYVDNFLIIDDFKTIVIENYDCIDPNVVEFYDSNNNLVTKVKGFFSVE